MKVFNVMLLLITMLWATITILMHRIEGANVLVWYAIGTPLVIIRVYKAYLEISLWLSKRNK